MTWAVLGVTSLAFAGSREDALLEVMNKMRSDERDAVTLRVNGLHESYLGVAGGQDRRLMSLALGVNYLHENPRLALQFLSSAELSCLDGDPLLPIIRFYEADAKFLGGASAEAAELASALLAQERGDAWMKQIHSLYIEALSASGDSARLVGAFQEYSKRFSFSRRQETLARLAVEALEKQEKQTDATELLEELARNYPTTEESRWAFHKLEDYACLPQGKGRYYFSQRLLLHLSRNVLLDTGLEGLLVAAVDRPVTYEDGSVHVMAPSEKADFFFRAKLYKQALKLVTEIYEAEKVKPSSPSLPNLKFEIGRIHLRMHDNLEATRAFSDFIFDYPKHPFVTRALEYLGDALRYSDEPLAAAQNYAEALTHKDTPLLRWLRFWSLYRGKDYKGALALLEIPGYVQPREGDDHTTVAYWHARILENLGKKAEASEKFAEILNGDANSFYALLAATLHPELVKGVMGPVLTTAPSDGGNAAQGMSLAARALPQAEIPAAPATEAESPGRADLKLIDDLLKVGLKDVASIQLGSLKWIGFNQEDTFAAIQNLSAKLGDYRPARNIRYTAFTSLKTLPRSWSELVQHQAEHQSEWKIFYPLAFDRILLPITAKIRLSPFLVLSIMRAESYYNKEARSGVGAQGLMQLMPYTALKIATILHDEQFDVRDLGKPELNIPYGSYYLDKLLRYYDDNPFLAAAAYNGGPIVVNQWLDSCKDCTADEFVDAIPYRETRRYVREVMRNYAQYVRIYTGKAAMNALPVMPAELPDGEEIF